MSKIFLLICSTLFTLNAFAWGQNGHRIVGQIAETYLSPKAQAKIKELLGQETLAQVSNWADSIKNDPYWEKSLPWHYLSIPKGKILETAKRAIEGDVLWAIENYTEILKNKKTKREDKKEALKFLVHFAGDVHQPLHTGRSEDEGGNKIKVYWFEHKTDMHKIWDETLINHEDLSFSEYTNFINHPKSNEVKSWQKSSPLHWYKESLEIRNEVYSDIEKRKNKSLSYDYVSKYTPIIHKRLLQGGVHLAGLLNEIFI